MANFEGKDRREATLKKVLPEYGFKNLDEARELCLSKGIDVDAIVKGIQPIAFDNASWAYTLGCAIAIKKVLKMLLMLLKQLVLGYKHLQFLVLLVIQEKLVSVTVT